MTPQKMTAIIEATVKGKITKVVSGLYFTRTQSGVLVSINHLTASDYRGTGVFGLWRVSDDSGDACDVSTYREAKEVALTWNK